MNPKDPTNKQCDNNEVVDTTFEGYLGIACWYPQMGGYTSHAVVYVPQEDSNGCFEAFVWHDGSFPFDEDSHPGEGPAHIHHCNPDQFVNFGNTIKGFYPNHPQNNGVVK